MYEIFAVFISGIVLLLFSTKTLIKTSKILSYSLKLSPLIVGLTVVAIGTSLPELSVSVIASERNDYFLAVGNIIGSNIINILLVFAVGILIGNLRVGTTKTPRNVFMLLFITGAFLFLQNFSALDKKTVGVVLITSVFLITYLEYKWALFGRTHEDSKKFNNKKSVNFSIGQIIMLALSIIGVITGGYLIVTSTEKLSLIVGLSTGILGMTLTAVATSLPELLTTIFSQEEHDEKMVIGNVIGSNIYNLLLIGGVIDLLSYGGGFSRNHWMLLVAVTLIFVLVIYRYRGKVIPKRVGVMLLIGFIGYMLLETLK